MFKPCVIIPVYNHARKISAIVAQLRVMQLPCLLLDDGSDEPCANVLDDLAELDGVCLQRWASNRGKGAVVCDGLIYAHQQGYTHALQVDADGQHNIDDVPAMLSCAKGYPNAVVSAQRAYQQMPVSRRRGRMLTDVSVWINTLSPMIKDSMCGFRVYPLPSTVALLEYKQVGRRMDFDTDILVRLYWHGVNVKHVPSAILYDENNTSHFDIWRDNVRISSMHTRLFFGMLLRSPKLILRHFKKEPV